MIIMNLKLDNILCFKDFNINFSYPKSLRKSNIENEYLDQLSSFRYKKLNIFLGSNACGKTSLMKSIWNILLFLSKKEKGFIDHIANKEEKEAYIEIDLVEKYNNANYQLYRIKIKYNLINDSLLISKNSLILDNGDSYEKKLKKLDAFVDDYQDYLKVLDSFKLDIGFFTALPATEKGFNKISLLNLEDEDDSKEYLDILKRVLMTLDSSILDIYKSNEVDCGYVLNIENVGKRIIQNGDFISDILYLSSGTKYGFNIANLIYSIKKHKNGIYLIDEQFSYINSDIEVAILNTMVSLLGEDEQIFFTTHNNNILDIPYPFHSFNFMRKEKCNNGTKIISSCATLVENRNNVSARTIIDNDMLLTAPNLNLIYELGEDNE